MEIRPSPNKVSALKRWAPLAILLSAMGFAFASGWHEYITLSNLIEHRDMLLMYVTENFALAILDRKSVV